MKYDIFISYRREGGDTLAQLLYDRLTYRGYRVFLDIESLNAGKFNEKLLDVIEECKDIIVVLPPKALDRCHNEGDWVYRELEYAISHSKNIIPVMMKDFVWPDNIPEAIADIKNYNGILDNKDYFDAVIDKITSLLKSRPVFGGRLFQRNVPKKSSFKEKVKKRKKIIVGGIAVLLVCAGVVGFLKYQEEEKRLREESFVTIKLSPNDEMSASEYYDVVEIVEKRFEILADGQECIIEEDKEDVTVSLPLEVFHDIEIENILQCYVTRPTEIYLASNNMDTEDVFHIERAEIESVERVTEVPVEVDFSNYELEGIDSEEDCQYFALTVNEDTVKEVKAWMAEKEREDYRLFQDIDVFGYEWNYSPAGIFEGDNKLYFVDNYQYENILSLIEHNYSNEAPLGHLKYSVRMPVHWENAEEEVLFGENQCNEDELSEDVVRYDFSYYSAEDMSEGEHSDTVRVLKARLDALGTPYAFGHHVNDPYFYSVKIDPLYMNNVVYSSIGKTDSLIIRSNLYNVIERYDIEEVKVVEEGDGTYAIHIIPTDYWKNYKKETFEQEIDAQENISLCLDDLIDSPLDTATVLEAYDGEKIVFRGYSCAELDQIDDSNKFIYDYLAVLHMDDDIPGDYTLNDLYGKEEIDPNEIDYIVPDNVISPKVKESYESILEKAPHASETEVTVTYIGEKVEIGIQMDENIFSAETVNDNFKYLYEAASMELGESSEITIDMYTGEEKYSENSKYISFTIKADSGYEHKVVLSAYYSTGLSEEFISEFEKILNEDEFYQKIFVSDYYMKDGKISFR